MQNKIKALLYLLSLICLCLVSPVYAQVRLNASGIQISALADGTLDVLDNTGKSCMGFGNYSSMNSQVETDGGTASLVKLADGTDAIHIDYRVKNDAAGKVKVQSQFTVAPHRVHIKYDIWGPADFVLDYAMLTRKSDYDLNSWKIIKQSQWVRDEKGGIPYEVPGIKGLQYKTSGYFIYLIMQGNNPQWQSPYAIHFPAKSVEAGHYVAEGDLLLTDADPAAALALINNRSVALDISTSKAFNIWDNSSSPLSLNTQVVNTSEKDSNITLSWWARDFNGKIVAKGSQDKMLDSYAKWDQTLKFPAPERGILFVEVQAKNGADTDFRRTNLAVLPQRKFNDPNSIFGISAYFPLPNEKDAENLLSRIGIKWIRNTQMPAKRAAELGMRQNFHAQVPLDDPEMRDPAKRLEFINKKIAEAKAGGAIYWEFGNEINMDGGIGNAVRAKQYVNDYLIPAHDLIIESGTDLKLTTIGLAGGDTGFLDKMHELGAWDYIDAVSLHPGRGNYTADYGGDNWQDTKNCDYWNYLGTIRKVKKTVEKYGNKPIFITETYASTAPNQWWKDTYRQAAENVVLEYALALAEGIKIVNWYQFNDTVWYDQGGVNNIDSEYHYGLLNRDLSPKPTLLGYETIAHVLEKAKFTRWIKSGKTQNKGILFTTPKGPVAILWNRTDGYIVNKNHPEKGNWFAGTEPWIDGWKTKVPVKLKASGKFVRQIDCIGQEKQIPVKNGVVKIILDGAPRIYYGLKADQLGF